MAHIVFENLEKQDRFHSWHYGIMYTHDAQVKSSHLDLSRVAPSALGWYQL